MLNRNLDRNTLFSLVIPVYNEQEMLPHLFERITRVADSLPVSVEVVLVNDCSSDDSLPMMIAHARKDARFRIVDLARNFGHQLAVCAGLAIARGQVAAILDADLQDPPEVLGAMLERWADGVDVVFGKRRSRKEERRFKLFTAWLYYRILTWLSNIEIPQDTGDFRVIDREVIDVINSMPERQKFLRGMFAWVGFHQEPFFYDRDARIAGATKYPFRRMFQLSLDGILSFSVTPLRLIIYLGLSFTAIAFIGAVFIIIDRILNPSDFPPAVAGVLISLLTMFGINFICLGIIGEYLGRNFINSQGRPSFIVRRLFQHGTITNHQTETVKSQAYVIPHHVVDLNPTSTQDT